jgi:hypothetical protein
MFLAAAVGACTHQPAVAVGTTPGVSSRDTPKPAAGPTTYEIPAQASFSISLVHPIGTRLSAKGNSFRGRLVKPLVTASGRTVVPAGAILTGRIVGVEPMPDAKLELRFETVETIGGTAKVHATTAQVQPDPSIVAVRPPRNDVGYDVALYAPLGIPLKGAALGTKKHAASESPWGKVRGDVRLGSGAQLKLTLIDPLRVELDPSKS